MAKVLATVLCATLAFAVAVAVANARDHVVGGNNGGGWKVPAQPDALNRWAEATRFHIGDNLGESTKLDSFLGVSWIPLFLDLF